MLVAIRVDSSTQIGSGHLMRCLTLAGQLHREHQAEVHFICRDLKGHLSHLLEERGYALISFIDMRQRMRVRAMLFG